jgi:carbamoyl-phosphate synthase large subunit
MNILITSVARKVWLVQAFQRAGVEHGAKVLAADADPLAAGLRLADGVVLLPRLDSSGFLTSLLEACRHERIGLIVPTRDAELPWFAAHRELLAQAGITVMVAAPQAIALCQDKLAFAEHCLAQGYAVPATLQPDQVATEFPLYARPRTGSGGRGAGRVANSAALAALHPREGWLVQECIGWPEYTIDLFADFAGQVISAVPRQRLRVVAGESVVGVTVEAPMLVERAASLSASLGLVGHNTLQCFWNGGEPLWIEVNPRYGGGAALGFAAGADSPAWLLRLHAGQTVASRLGEYERGLYLYRYSTDYFCKGQP